MCLMYSTMEKTQAIVTLTEAVQKSDLLELSTLPPFGLF